MSISVSHCKPSIQHIFDTMDYGSVSEGKTLGELWLKENNDLFGPFINGKLKVSGDSENIATGVNSCASLKLNKEQDYSSALSAASSALSRWTSMAGHSKAKIIYSVARQLQKHTSLISEVEALSRGVQLSDARDHDLPALIRIFYYYAGWAQLKDTDLAGWTPYGTVVGILTSSAPLASLAMFVAPALAAGNTITLLPSTSNCLSALLLAQICSASGVPAGVINVVPQDHSDIANCLAISDSRVKKIAVIGSPSVGRALLSSSKQFHQDIFMLLNGCVPMIVLESADLDAAVDCTVETAWINQGQDPWAIRLLIVQEVVYEAFKAKLTARVRSLKIGGPFEKIADFSNHIVDSCMAQKMKETLAVDPSFEVVKPADSRDDGWVPTVIFSSAPPALPVLHTTDPCPCLYVVGARTAKEAVSIANHYGAGAAASVWTECSAFAWESSLLLKAGTVWLNSHGIMDACIPVCGRNSSGTGCFLGKGGFLEYLQPDKISQATLHHEDYLGSTTLLPSGLLSDMPTVDQTYKLFYGGGHKRPSSNAYRTILDVNSKPVAVVPEANRKDVRNAVEAAVKAQPSWWKRGVHNRAQILYNFAEKLDARQKHFASHLHSVYKNVEIEKCLHEVERSVKLLFHYAAISDKIYQSSAHSAVSGMAVSVLREPIGTIAIINASCSGSALLDLVTLLGAALTYGNACVVAACPNFPTPALELALLLEAAELPAGVINILSGPTETLLPTLCGHMEVNAVWCVGYNQKHLEMIKSESGQSNFKQSWVMDQIIDPLHGLNRQVFEMKASQSKAIWAPTVASFGS